MDNNESSSRENSLGTADFKSFIDENMNSHSVNTSKILGQGGQGIVYRTEDSNIALKLALKDGQEITDPEEIEKFRQNIKKLLLLQLPKDIKVSAPISILYDKAGYIMKMLSTAKSFEFFQPKNIVFHYFPDFDENVNSLLSSDLYKLLISENEKNADEDSLNKNEKLIRINKNERELFFRNENSHPLLRYALTGGVRLRTFALGQAASQMARLHSLGLVYGDISSKNVYFVPDNGNKTTVWFIDADNLDYEKKRGIVVYTPQYGAPELIQRSPDGNTIDGIRSVSDCHAFSVLVSLVLSWVHPFIGKAVLDNDDFSDADDVEESALEGRLPWIDDPEDSSNQELKMNKALPRSIIYTPYIKTLLKLTFCEGRTQPFLRPSIYNWGQALIQAHDSTIKCQNPLCGMTLYHNGSSRIYKCAACDTEFTKNYIITFKSYRLTKKGRFKNYDWLWTKEISFQDDSFELNIPYRVFEPFDNRNFDNYFLTIKSKTKEIFCLQKNSNVITSKLYIAKKNSPQHSAFTEISINNFVISIDDLKQIDNVWLMCVTKDGYHRLISINLQGDI